MFGLDNTTISALIKRNKDVVEALINNEGISLPEWVKSETKPDYTPDEVGAAPSGNYLKGIQPSELFAYWGMALPDGSTDNKAWLRTTEAGIIPHSNGVGFIGTSSWKFNEIWSNSFNGKSLIDNIYPVGAIYQSLSATSPATLFGGTWAAIGAGRFLVAAGSGYAAGATGGAASVALTVAQMPVHHHVIPHHQVGAAGSATWTISTGPGTTTTGSSGSGTAHENRPPYYAVYMWRRTA